MLDFLGKVGIWIVRISVAIFVVNLLFSFVPIMGLPADFASAFSWVVQLLVNFDFIIPVSLAFDLLMWSLFVEVIFLGIHAIMWIYNLFNRT